MRHRLIATRPRGKAHYTAADPVIHGQETSRCFPIGRNVMIQVQFAIRVVVIEAVVITDKAP